MVDSCGNGDKQAMKIAVVVVVSSGGDDVCMGGE
jgi:hypothetical protein